MGEGLKIGRYNVPLELLHRYAEVVIKWEATSKGGRYVIEQERERLHNEILDVIGLERGDYPAYPDFRRALEDYISDMMPKEDIVIPRKLIAPKWSNPEVGEE